MRLKPPAAIRKYRKPYAADYKEHGNQHRNNWIDLAVSGASTLISAVELMTGLEAKLSADRNTRVSM